MKNYFTDTLNKKEKAEEDIYFAKLDRMLIEKNRRNKDHSEEGSSAKVEDLDTQPGDK